MQFAGGIQGNQGTLTARARSRQLQETAQVQTLNYGQTQTIEARPGLEIFAEKGVLWLTQEGEQGDILLRAGRRWTATKAGRVVVQSLVSDATWTLRDPATPAKTKLGLFASIARLWAA